MNEVLISLPCLSVRLTIASHVKYLDVPLHVNKELRLYHCVSDFVKAYAGLMKLVSTLFLFPLVQMTRTFLFIWIYMLPWVLVNDYGHKLPALVFMVFFITYGEFSTTSTWHSPTVVTHS